MRPVVSYDDITPPEEPGPPSAQLGPPIPSTNQPPAKKRKVANDDESATEDEGDGALPSPAASDIAPGRVIGNTSPLEDFKRTLSRGDLVTKAVQDMGDVIEEIVKAGIANLTGEKI